MLELSLLLLWAVAAAYWQGVSSSYCSRTSNGRMSAHAWQKLTFLLLHTRARLMERERGYRTNSIIERYRSIDDRIVMFSCSCINNSSLIPDFPIPEFRGHKKAPLSLSPFVLSLHFCRCILVREITRCGRPKPQQQQQRQRQRQHSKESLSLWEGGISWNRKEAKSFL